MRLSEAIMLGRHLVEKQMCGLLPNCAMGMALRASGWTDLTFDSMYGYELVKLWPWLNNPMPQILPCDHLIAGIKNQMTYAIMHLFDGHVCVREDWTLEQLVDWVRSVEPAEQDSALRSETPEEQIAPALANGTEERDFALSSSRE